GSLVATCRSTSRMMAQSPFSWSLPLLRQTPNRCCSHYLCRHTHAHTHTHSRIDKHTHTPTHTLPRDTHMLTHTLTHTHPHSALALPIFGRVLGCPATFFSWLLAVFIFRLNMGSR